MMGSLQVNVLVAIALNHGLRSGKSPWSKTGQQALASLPLAEYSRQCRKALQLFYAQPQAQIDELSQVVSDLARKRQLTLNVPIDRRWGCRDCQRQF